MRSSDLFGLLSPEFGLPPPKSSGRIAEVVIGATKDEGGTRARRIRLGGDRWFPFFSNQKPSPKRPIVGMQVLDVPHNVPYAVREALGDAVNDPVEWSRVCVERFGAEAIALCLIGTSSHVKGIPPNDAARIVEDVLQAVDVPLIIGGSGDVKRDPEVLERASAAAQGERCLLASVTLDTDYERIARAAMTFDHVLLASSVCDPIQQRTLNDSLLEIGVPINRIVMDPLTSPLGYGLEYTFNFMELLRAYALQGEVKSLQVPLAALTANAWSALEAQSADEELGPLHARGPLWEAMTAVPLFLAGAELFVMLHPKAMGEFSRLVSDVFSKERPERRYVDWITAES